MPHPTSLPAGAALHIPADAADHVATAWSQGGAASAPAATLPPLDWSLPAEAVSQMPSVATSHVPDWFGF